MARSWSAIALSLLVACGAPAPEFDGGEPDAGPTPVDGGRRDAAMPDGGRGMAEVGDACRSHGDCADGFCVDGAGAGGVCTRECGEACPDEWSCRSVDVGGVIRELCIPLLGDHCSRCASDAECVSGACLEIDGVGHCAPSCASAAGCPSGYACEVDPSGERSGSFCQPVSGSCACDERSEGTTRTCANVNEIGTCWGTQTCEGAAGWTECDARTAEPEVCDGVDNDCNFIIDDGLETGESCMNTVEGVGSCPGVEVCGGEEGFICQGQIPRPERCNYIDDNCNGEVDEDFPDVGEVCSDGIGACLAFGAVRCTADGMGTECSAVAGTPSAERCNNIDDNCNGEVDEDFPDLGQGCSVGLGACLRFGTVVCAADELSSTCSATPGPAGVEVCNYQDDDCDGQVDNGFRNAATGLYDQDTTCGSCDIDCTALLGGLPNSFGQCEVIGGAPVCTLGCTAGAFNLNGSNLDGCEFVLNTGVIYVARNAPSAVDDAGCGLGPPGTGAGNYPCRTIGQGLDRAEALGRGAVWVADGTYDEAVTIRNGIDLLGGFRADTWERQAEVTATVIQGVSVDGPHDRTVMAFDITAPTLFEGFVIQGSFNAKPSGNSYALYISNASSALTVRGNFIYAGRGGSGAAGTVGANGTTGANGTGRDSPGVDPIDYDARVTSGPGQCNASNNRAFANGGSRTCSGDNVGGGNGGGVTCPPSNDRVQQSASNGVAGQPAASGAGSAGSGGSGGQDGSRIVIDAGEFCLVPTRMDGNDGENGSRGTNAAGVVGCASPGGGVSGAHWAAGAGSAGLAGTPGGGGGGGAAGGGGYCDGCSEGFDRLGGHGGGGGSGACGGLGGGSGQGGGGAFGILVVGGAPNINGNLILQGDGGVGGRGGQGGAGGLGGIGGSGGGELNCGGRGGRGGDGGDGGHGSGGGGGCGGPSFGIYTSGVSSPAYCSGGANNTIAGGSAGPGGAGGLSPGSPGGPGSDGILEPCRFE